MDLELSCAKSGWEAGSAGSAGFGSHMKFSDLLTAGVQEHANEEHPPKSLGDTIPMVYVLKRSISIESIFIPKFVCIGMFVDPSSLLQPLHSFPTARGFCCALAVSA